MSQLVAPTATWLLAASLLCLSAAANAHKASDSYLFVDTHQRTLRIDVALADAHDSLDLDSNGDGALRWGEVRQQHRRIADWLARDIAVYAGSARCQWYATSQLAATHVDGVYTSLSARLDCGGATASRLDYALRFEADPGHRAVLRLDWSGHESVEVLHAQRRSLDLVRSPSATESAWHFFGQGALHLLVGYDHLLFLAVLMLPLLRLAHARRQIAALVTAFTVGHSATLALAGTGTVLLPSQLVETGIAASIVLAALLNLRSGTVAPRTRLPLVIGLGLLHGFGFAGVLAGLGGSLANTAVALAAFNFGIEAAQLLLVAVAWPCLRWAAATVEHRELLIRGCSALAATLGLGWCVARATGDPANIGRTALAVCIVAGLGYIVRPLFRTATGKPALADRLRA